MLFHKSHSGKQGFPLRLLTAAFIISIFITVFNGWQLWNEHNRFKEMTSIHIAITENIGRIMLFDETLTTSARLCASTGDFSYEDRYNQFDPQLTAAINDVRSMLPQPEIESFVIETDEANLALVDMERQAFALTHQDRRQEAMALLTSDEYVRLKEIYANGMLKTISAKNSLIEKDIQHLQLLSFISMATNTAGTLILLATWFFAARSTRIWATDRMESENKLRKARDELEVRVKQRTVALLNTNEQLQCEISEHKHAKETLNRSEIKYHTLYDSTSDAVMLLDEQGIFDCNKATLTLFGYTTRAEFTSIHAATLSPPQQQCGTDSMVLFNQMIASAIVKGSNRFEWTYKRNDTDKTFPADVVLTVMELDGRQVLQAVVRDITERKHAEEQIQYLATHDSLTGLPNRLMFSQLLNHSIQSAKHHKRQLAVFFLDLDRFKIINDTKGHDAGDLLLQEMAQRFKQALRAADIVARQGGDEFIILIEDVDDLSHVEIVAHKILINTIKPVVLLGEECHITASIGISIYPSDGEDEQSLMKNADIALYFAKEEGRNNYQFYSKDIQSQSTERLLIETNLRHALERNEFTLHYQAKVDFKTNMITGVEALLRWQNPFLGSVTPTQFIPVAEETGLILSIGKWVMRMACAQNVAWQKQGLPTVCMAINLSLQQLNDDNLIEDIRTILKETGMAPNLLELEIKENMVLYDISHMISVLNEIKSMGVRLAMDNFGANYSSLNQIKNFPIDTLKIDRSFIRNVPKEVEDNKITQAIINIGSTLSLNVVAEGVETLEQMNFLKDHFCDEMQGYYFSKPIAPEQFAELLREHVPTPIK